MNKIQLIGFLCCYCQFLILFIDGSIFQRSNSIQQVEYKMLIVEEFKPTKILLNLFQQVSRDLLIVYESIHRWCFVLQTKCSMFVNNVIEYSFNIPQSMSYIDRSRKPLKTIQFQSYSSCFKGNIITIFTQAKNHQR